MAKIKYTAKENTKVGRHSFYAVPIPTGKLTFRELCEEACSDNTYSIEEMTGCVSKFMKAVQREALRGWRCDLGENFLTIYPNIEASVKDYVDKEGNTVVVTAKMLTASNAKSRLGCTVHKKFSALFAQEVSWQKVNADGTIVEEEEDITQNNENAEGGGDNTQQGGSDSGGDNNNEGDAN